MFFNLKSNLQMQRVGNFVLRAFNILNVLVLTKKNNKITTLDSFLTLNYI